MTISVILVNHSQVEDGAQNILKTPCKTAWQSAFCSVVQRPHGTSRASSTTVYRRGLGASILPQASHHLHTNLCKWHQGSSAETLEVPFIQLLHEVVFPNFPPTGHNILGKWASWFPVSICCCPIVDSLTFQDWEFISTSLLVGGNGKIWKV